MTANCTCQTRNKNIHLASCKASIHKNFLRYIATLLEKEDVTSYAVVCHNLDDVVENVKRSMSFTWLMTKEYEIGLEIISPSLSSVLITTFDHIYRITDVPFEGVFIQDGKPLEFIPNTKWLKGFNENYSMHDNVLLSLPDSPDAG